MALKVTNRKFYRYIYFKLLRQSGTAHYLALGTAIGIFCGFVIPIFQIPLAILLAWIFRGHKILAIACTWVSNPLTYAIVFPLNIFVGSFFINSTFDESELEKFSFTMIFTDFMEIVKFFCSDGMLMMIIGGAIIGAICAVISYILVIWLVLRHKGEKLTRLKLRREFLNKSKTDLAG